MCRLLGVVSRRDARLTELLGQDLGPFVELSSIHCDGWGIAAWDTDDSLVVTRQPGAANLEPRLTAVTDTLITDAALLHLRKASAGMRMATSNTHPFAAGSVAFAHNGYFSPADTVGQALADLRAPTLEGDTDSERYFAMVTALMRREGPVDALLRAAEIITEGAGEVVALNAMMLTRDALFAYCQYAAGATSAGLESGGSSYDLRFRAEQDRVVVASTGWAETDQTWQVLGQHSVLEVRRHDLAVSVHRRSFAAPSGLPSQESSRP
jgi:predicted glutamine amidotransferase